MKSVLIGAADLDKPAVSIIIPVYNVEQYLPSCLESVSRQTYQNIETILIDDGSTDSCGDICDEYASRFEYVKVIHQDNSGLSAARNAGLGIATGKYVSFLDSDDLLLPDAIKHLVYLAESHGADFVSGACDRCDDKTVHPLIPKDRKAVINEYSGIDKMRAFLKDDDIGTTAWGKLYHRSLFKTIRFPIGKYHEDVFTTYRVVHESQKIVTTSEKVYCYRYNQNSITHGQFSLKRLDAVDGKLAQEQFVSDCYPTLKGLAASDVVYACCHTMREIGGDRKRYVGTVSYLQSLLRGRELCYLKSQASLFGKVYSIVLYFSPSIASQLAFYCGKFS